MGAAKDMNDDLYEGVIDRLIADGKIADANDLTNQQNNTIIGEINCDENFEELYRRILKKLNI